MLSPPALPIFYERLRLTGLVTDVLIRLVCSVGTGLPLIQVVEMRHCLRCRNSDPVYKIAQTLPHASEEEFV
jgi:hypothetical protein